jgi:hypothetical protein
MSTEPVLPEEALRSRVRQLMETGRLPAMRPMSIIAGYGGGQRCAVCDQAIASSMLKYEVLAPDKQPLRFHFACFVIWQRACPKTLDASRP